MKKIRTIEAPVLELKRLRVCAYVRVSTNEAEQQESFSAQVQHYTTYINSNPIWSFAGIYSDQGISGKNKEKRPEFMRMVKDAENKKFDLIITKSISRFARNKIDTLETVRKLKSIGIGIYFERENINTLTAQSELMLSLLSSVAEEELVSMSQNMRWSNQRRFKQGKFSVNTKRFLGYDRDKEGNLVVNEEQAAIVQRIFNDYLSGLGFLLIAKGLKDDGIRTLTGNVKWAESTVRDILKNEKYVGDALLQKTITTDSFKRKRNKGEAAMHYVEGSHPAIISKEDFAKVQELMVKRAESKGNIDGNREKYLNRYAFTGTIICGHCGNTFKRHIDNCGSVAESACWVCNTYINEGKNSCCIGRIKEETIKGLFVRVFNRLYSDRAKLDYYRARLEREKLAESDDGQLTKLDAEIEELIRQERMLLTFKDMGYADLQSEHEELAGNLTKLQTERAELVAELTKQDERKARTLELEAIIEAQGGPILEFSEDLYSRIVDKIVVKERTKLVFHLKNGLSFEEHYTLKRGRDLL